MPTTTATVKLPFGIKSKAPIPGGELETISCIQRMEGYLIGLVFPFWVAQCFDLVDVRIGAGTAVRLNAGLDPMPLLAFVETQGESAILRLPDRLLPIQRTQEVHLDVLNISGAPMYFSGIGLIVTLKEGSD